MQRVFPKYFLVFSIVFCLIINFPTVFADNQTNDTVVNNNGDVSENIPDGCTQLMLYLPSELSGTTFDIKNAITGESVGNITVDSTGSGSVVIPVQKSMSVSASIDTPSANKNKKTSGNISVSSVIFFALVSIIASSFIFYQIGKKKTMKRFDAALDVVYNEELDD